LSVFAVMAVWEVLAPRRALTVPKAGRWAANLGIIALDVGVARLLAPLAALSASAWADARGLGLLHGLPALWAVPLSVVLLDLAIYTQHLVFHRVPWLWALHRVHHADLDYDVTTGLRFHPLEIVLSMAIKVFVVVALGAPAAGVVLFEVILNGMAMFNHGNVGLPERVDAVLRWVWVTPDLHRVHHSVLPHEHHRNFGFNLSVWDRLFGTVRDVPQGGQIGMTIGLPDERDPEVVARLIPMLAMPLRAPSAAVVAS
jgi:sterol desaturase/sphingolipid hydroxylase (fatty acid hydroxylase superfamily)